jgi:hypothetical protein
MMINTTEDPRPDAKPDPAIEPPSASKTQPGPGVPDATSEPELEARIKQRRAELIAKLAELRSDTRAGVAEARGKLKLKLSELAHIVKWGVVDGWASIGAPVAHKLEQWLGEAARQLAARNEQS